MKIAFLTEMGFEGKVQPNHSNMRTEFAWMLALDADHRHIHDYKKVGGYDHVFVIFPKGMVYLNSIGLKMSNNANPISELLQSNFIDILKENNSKVHFVQEGPHWLWNDYEISDQLFYYNMIFTCDSIFCHSSSDVAYYIGMFPNKKVNVIPTLMIDELISNIKPNPQDKVIVGGNFSRWYGGFESYLMASDFKLPIYAQSSHAQRENEDQLVTHLPRMVWIDWMKELSTFKYAVHLMPTVAAGTFSLNCAYFGIPCIGNIDVDSQRLCHPNLSVDVNNIEKARYLVNKLKTDKDFYYFCSDGAKKFYHNIYGVNEWKTKMKKILNEN